MIRAARAVDLPGLMALLREAYARSRYKDVGEIAEKPTEQMLLALILKHGVKAIDGTLTNVIEVNGTIVGLHFACKERIKLIGTKFFASDAFFYVQQGHGTQALGLLAAFFAWAEADPRVFEITPGTDDTIQDWRSATKMYNRFGFEQCGAILRRKTRIAA